MRTVVSAFVVAILIAGTLGVYTATPAAAALTKPCWAHMDNDPLSETFGQLVPVWASGGGHDKHQLAGYDTPLGETETRALCEEAFATNFPE